MQATEHRMGDDAAIATPCWRPFGDALPDSLMRTSSVEERRILTRRPSEMVLVEDEHMIEHLARSDPTNRSAIAFMFGARTAVLITRIPTPSAARSNIGPYLSSRSRMKNWGAVPPWWRSGSAEQSSRATDFAWLRCGRFGESPGER